MDSLAMVSGTAARLTGNKTKTRPTGQKGSTKRILITKETVMKERLKEFIIQKLGGKLPDDPCQNMIKVCGIKVLNGDSFNKEFGIIDKYVASSLYVGVCYSDH